MPTLNSKKFTLSIVHAYAQHKACPFSAQSMLTLWGKARPRSAIWVFTLGAQCSSFRSKQQKKDSAFITSLQGPIPALTGTHTHTHTYIYIYTALQATACRGCTHIVSQALYWVLRWVHTCNVTAYRNTVS
jgi:hypothetical protein